MRLPQHNFLPTPGFRNHLSCTFQWSIRIWSQMDKQDIEFNLESTLNWRNPILVTLGHIFSPVHSVACTNWLGWGDSTRNLCSPTSTPWRNRKTASRGILFVLWNQILSTTRVPEHSRDTDSPQGRHVRKDYGLSHTCQFGQVRSCPWLPESQLQLSGWSALLNRWHPYSSW